MLGKKRRQSRRGGLEVPREEEDTATHREVMRMGCTEVMLQPRLEGSIPSSRSHMRM